MPDVPFSTPAYDALETLAEAMDVPIVEAIRRACILLEVCSRLNEDEELAVLDRHTGQLERLRFAWTRPTLIDEVDRG
jgi:hypothetical protein